MCGFVAALAKTPRGRLPAATLGRMDAAIRHRGPDDHVQSEVGQLSLGFRRLSVIDLIGGKQPMTSSDGNFVVAYNGEIYNYLELRAELERGGYSFRDRSDTEVLLAAWMRWGEACLDRLNGMFAFIIYDKVSGALFAARDRFGEKSLYYSDGPDGLYLASELKALVVGGVVGKQLAPAALYSYFTLGYVAGEEAVFSDARRLPAGYILKWTPGQGLSKRRWWAPPPPTDELDDEAAVVRQSLDLLRDSVRIRRVADVPLGFFLSGGIDSSAIVALARESTPDRLDTFTIGFDDDAYDERPYARRVAEHLGTRHHELLLGPPTPDILERIAWYADEPFADQAAVSTWFLSELTRRHVTVALSGDGGDEIFGGYGVYRSHYLGEWIRRVPAPARRIAARALREYPRLGHGAARVRLARWVEDTALPAFERFIARQQTVLRRDFLIACFDALTASSLPADRDIFAALFQCPGNVVGGIALWLQTTSLSDRMLHKVDRMSMAHSLEVRTPFLDPRLAQLLNRTSFAVKLAGSEQKHVLRRAIGNLLPHESAKRQKRGFVAPIAQWLKGELASHLADRLTCGKSVARTLIKPAEIEKMLGEHTAGSMDHSQPIWAMLMFEEWCRVHGIRRDSLELGRQGPAVTTAIQSDGYP